MRWGVFSREERLRAPGFRQRVLAAVIRYSGEKLAEHAGARITKSKAREILQRPAARLRCSTTLVMEALARMRLLHVGSRYVYVPIVWRRDFWPVLHTLLEEAGATDLLTLTSF